MSLKFPVGDTFQNHFNQLLSFHKPPKDNSWSHILVVEEQFITWGSILVIQRSAQVSANEYEKRFNELLNQGYDWINMTAIGIIEDSFIVGIEFPLKSRNVPRNKVSVNYSGPHILNNEPQWDLSNRVIIT